MTSQHKTFNIHVLGRESKELKFYCTIYKISLCLFTPTYIVIPYMKYMEKLNKWDNIVWCTLVTTYIFIPYMTYVGYIE